MMAAIWVASTIRWSTGASGGRRITSKPAPMCSDSTMFSSQIAFSIGSQWPDMKLGSPYTWGVSRKLIDRQPFLPSRCISSAARSGSQFGTMPRGMNRPG